MKIFRYLPCVGEDELARGGQLQSDAVRTLEGGEARPQQPCQVIVTEDVLTRDTLQWTRDT